MPENTSDEEHPLKGLEPEIIVLPPEAFDRLIEALENPPEPTEKLKELMRGKEG